MYENNVKFPPERAKGAVAAAVDSHLQKLDAHAGLSLLFVEGERPHASDVERLLASLSGQRARISHRPEGEDGWLELLASGLTFDLSGLAPVPAAALPSMRHQFGIALDPKQFHFEAIDLRPGRHIAGGGAMMPVVRTMIGLAVGLAVPLPVKAVCWHPAHSLMEPSYFTRVVVNWLSGGAFPALGLTAVEPHGAGGVASHGLDFFAGQEVRVEPKAGEPHAETVKLAVRVIDHIIRNGPLTALQELSGPSGEAILAEPSHDGRQVRVWRSA